jgi:hypothetical protein
VSRARAMGATMTDGKDARAAIGADERRIREIAFWLAVLIAVLGSVAFVYLIYSVTFASSFWLEIVHDHFVAIVGLPLAAATAFGVVVFLRQASGPIEFEGLGFKFRGAAGQVVMWVLCFLALAGALKLLW